MLFGISLIINILVFLLLFNLSWLIEKRKNSELPPPPVSKSILMPVMLGLALTILDTMRIQFAMQLGILLVLAGLLYWAFSIFLRK